MAAEEDVTVRKPRFSLRLKLTVGLVLIIGIIFSGLNVFNIYSQQKRMKDETDLSRDNLGRVLAMTLSVQLGEYDLHDPKISRFVKNFLTNSIVANKKNKDIAYGLVVDTNDNLIAGRTLPKMLRFPGNKIYTSELTTLQKIVERRGDLGGYIKTIRFKLVAGPQRQHVGWLYVGASRERVERETTRALYINLAVFAGTLVLLFVYSALALARMVTRPIGQVMTAMHAVQEGRFDKEVKLDRNDEMGVLADTYNIMVRGLREREQLKDAFSRYVSTQVYDKLKLGEINLQGETRDATILFSDIRSFTALSERLPPSEVVKLLNDYFNVMVEIVFKHEGFLNKFIGDALMAVYNVPIDQDQPELRAVRTALEMTHTLEQFNTERAQRGLFRVKIGIGINTGPVTAGNIGHMRRLEYTVIGDSVNLAQRIESQTKVTGMPILISETTFAAVARHVLAQALPPVKVKGKQEPVALYAVTGLQDAAPDPSPPT